jgi:hypothetical protein
MRRLMALLLVWLGLLGAAGQALACAAAVDLHCCPPGAASHCGDHAPATPAGPELLCCAAVSSPMQAIAGDAVRDFKHHLAPHAPAALPSAPPDAPGSTQPFGYLSSRHLPAWSDSALTYLRTGRLRL